MSQLPLPTYDLTLFTWDKKNRTLVAEASDLCRTGGQMFNRVWADACDLGLAIQSHRTGKIFRFMLDGEQADREGEITSWILKPCGIGCPVQKIIIFND